MELLPRVSALLRSGAGLVVVGIVLGGGATAGAGGRSAISFTPGVTSPRVEPPVVVADARWSSSEPVPAVEPDAACEVLARRSDATRVMDVAPETEVTTEISELARGLRGDPVLIYEFVRNSIDYAPVFGALRSATATLLDRRGNDFDQTSLLIALLRASGFEASYIYGRIRLTPTQVTDWLGTPADPDVVEDLLTHAGIPVLISTDGSGNLVNVELAHVWATVDIDGTSYALDPSLKSHAATAPIDLAAALGYERTAFLARATAGMSSGSDWLQYVNRSNVRADLATMAGNLVNTIKSTAPGATLGEVIGGRRILPVWGAPLLTTLPYELARYYTWTDIPPTYQTTLRIQHLGIDETIPVPALARKRLTIFYSASMAPALLLDGEVLAMGQPGQGGTWAPLMATVDHPYPANGGTYGDDTNQQYLVVGGAYFVSVGFDRVSHATVEWHQKRLAGYLEEGLSPYSEPVLGETLAVIGHTWLAGCSRAQDLGDALARTITVHHHVLGVVGQTDAPWMDMPLSRTNTISTQGDSVTALAKALTQMGAASAFEWGAIAQTQPSSAVSTVKLLDAAVAAAGKLFDATSANWATVKPQLTNWTPTALSSVESYVNAGYRVLLPQVGSFYDGSYKGVGYLVVTPEGTGTFYIITGGLLHGGYANGGYVADPDEALWAQVLKEAAEAHRRSEEPVDLVTGAYLHDHVDLSVGSRPFPFGLDFKRSYSSHSRRQDGVLGRGWSHNWEIRSRGASNAFLTLGEASPVDAAAVIAPLYVAIDLLRGTTAKERLVIATLVQRFFQDQLIDNTVEVAKPGGPRTFVKLADGSYNPPPGALGLLTRGSGESGTLRGAHGDVLAFDTEGKLATWTDPNGNAVTLTYSGGELQSVGNGMARSLGFAYEGGRLATVSDSAGRTVTFSYDAGGNLLTATGPAGGTIAYQYDLPGRLTRVLYPATPASPVVTNTYDDLDRVTEQRDGGGNLYTYFYGGGRTEEIDPLGSSRVATFDLGGRTTLAIDPLGHETGFSYDGQGRLTRTIFPEGNAVVLGYDGRHNLVLVRRLPKPASPLDPIVTQLAYETTFNRMTSLTDALGRTTTFGHDTKGNLVRTDFPAVDAQAPWVATTLNARGQVTRTDRPHGVSETRTYEPATADLTSVTVDPGGLGLVTSYTSSPAGDVLTMTDRRGKVSSFTYDLARRLTGVSQPLGAVTTYAYDLDGKLTAVSRATGDVANPWQVTHLTYTVSGRQASLTDPLGHTVLYTYDAADRPWKITDAEGRTVQRLYDAAGRFTRQVNPLGQVVEEQAYTPNGLEASVKDGNGNLTSYTRDGFDRVVRMTYANGSYRELGYDAEGNCTQQRQRSGAVVTASFDALNRLRSRTYPGPLVTSYSYDLNGRLLSAADESGTITHTYDKAGRLVGVAYPGGKVVTHEVDAEGNLTRLVYPDGQAVTYSYDDLGRITDIRSGTTTLLAHYAYDPLSRRTGVTFGNGTATTYAYDLGNNLTSLHHAFAGGAVDFTYAWDDAHFLVGAQVSDPVFDFDPGTGAADTFVPNALNGIATANGSPYTYDGNGNLAAAAGSTYTWDARNQLVAATVPGHTLSFTYDALGRRTAKTVDGVKTSYLQDGSNVLMELDGAGATLRRWVCGPHLDEPVRLETGGGSYTFHGDHLGSVVALSDSSGAPVETYAYDPYGQPARLSAVGNTTLFAGREVDAETGLSYNRPRYYAPGSGRFISMDPLGFGGGDLNLYSYGLGNPVMFTDPYGETAVHAAGVVLVVAVVAGEVLDIRVRVKNLPQRATAQAKGPIILLGPDYDKLHPAVQRAIIRHEKQHKHWDWWQVFWKSPARSEIFAHQRERDYLLSVERPRYEKKGDAEALAAIDQEVSDLDALLANGAANLRAMYPGDSWLAAAGKWAISGPVYPEAPDTLY